MPKPKPKARKSRPRKTPIDVLTEEILANSPIKIGPHFFLIKVYTEADWPCDKDNSGCIHYDKKELHIQVDADVPHEMADILFHEIIHGANNYFLKANRALKASHSEEAFTLATETGLTTIFVDNPKLLALLVKYWNPANRQPSPSKGDLK